MSQLKPTKQTKDTQVVPLPDNYTPGGTKTSKNFITHPLDFPTIWIILCSSAILFTVFVIIYKRNKKI